MGKTRLSIHGDKFYINDCLTYSEYPNCKPNCRGLLFNQRLIQGVFDDTGNRERYRRSEMEPFDPDENTNLLIKALPHWYAVGLRAITVGFQGGWPHSAVSADKLNNNPFGADGCSLDDAYAMRMDRIIKVADKLGMVVIVNFLYWAQTNKFKDGQAIVNAIQTGCRFLKDGGYSNVIIDVANDYTIDYCAKHPLINKDECMAALIEMAKEASGGLPTGCSGGGGCFNSEVAEASDVVFVHGNGLTRGEFYTFTKNVIKIVGGKKPIVFNEDSACISRFDIALDLGVSWGYYNNYTKQIPPCSYDIARGEDMFFAEKMVDALGIHMPDGASCDEDIVLQGGTGMDVIGEGLCFFRIASKKPEQIYKVEYYLNGVLDDVSYDEPFFYHTEQTWISFPWVPSDGDILKAVVFMADGTVIEKQFEKK